MSCCGSIKSMVDRYSEKRRASNLKSTVDDRKKTEDEGNFSSVFTYHSGTPILKNQQLNDSSIMQSSFDPRRNPSADRSALHDLSLVESVFCTPSQVRCCLSYLNKEFIGIGLPPVVKSPSENTDVVRLVNNAYKLVQRNRQTYRLKEEQEVRQIQADGEISRLRQIQAKMSSQLEEKERELTQLQLIVSQLETKNKQLSNSLKSEKEEVRRLHSTLQQRLAQYKHESKKKELEVNRLKDRLHQIISERTEKHGIVISAVVPPKPKFRSDEDAFRMVIANYEDTQRKIRLENSDLRQALCSFQSELMELLEAARPSRGLALVVPDDEDGTDPTQILESSLTSALVKDSVSSALHQLPGGDLIRVAPSPTSQHWGIMQSLSGCGRRGREDPIEAIFEMPFELVETDILTSFRQKFSQLKNIVKLSKTRDVNEDEKKLEEADRKRDVEIKRLREEVECLKSIVEQQNAFILSQFEQGTAEVSFLRDTDHLEEERWSEVERFVCEAKQKLNDVTAKIIEEMTEEQTKNYHLMSEQFSQLTPMRSNGADGRFDRHAQSSLRKSASSGPREPTVSGIQTPCFRMGNTMDLPGTADLYQKLAISPVVIQSSPFVAKSQAFQEKADEKKENECPRNEPNDDLDDRSLRLSAALQGADELCSPFGCLDRVKVQLFSQKLTAAGATPEANHVNSFHNNLDRKISIKDDQVILQNGLVQSSVVDHDATAQSDLDENAFAGDFLDSDSIKFDEDDDEFFRNTFLSSKSEN